MCVNNMLSQEITCLESYFRNERDKGQRKSNTEAETGEEIDGHRDREVVKEQNK